MSPKNNSPEVPFEVTPRLRDYSWLTTRTGIKRATLACMVSRGQLPCVRLGARLARFDEQEIERWLRERSAAVTAEMAQRREGKRLGGAA